jgi:hypothetical protein
MPSFTPIPAEAHWTTARHILDYLRPGEAHPHSMQEAVTRLIAAPQLLADRCFDSGLADDQLFSAIQELLGGRPTEECLDETFQWMVTNSWVDPYDSSVEIYIPAGSPRLDRAKADAILALGFGQIYENAEGAERAAVWTRSGCSAASNKWKEGDGIIQLRKARVRITELEAKVAELERITDVLP